MTTGDMTEEMAGWGSLLSYYRDITHSQHTLRYFGRTTNKGVKWSNLWYVYLIATWSPWLSFASMQASWWRHMPPLIPAKTTTRFWCPNSKTIRWWFWDPNHQTPLEKHICYASTISTHVIVVLDRPITKSSSAFAWLGQHGLLRMYSCLLMSSSVSHPRSAFRPSWSLGPSLTSIMTEPPELYSPRVPTIVF
jgi:hypothetical protein